jgi:hypothetical protein
VERRRVMSGEWKYLEKCLRCSYMRPGETELQAECAKTDRLILQPMDAELYCPIDGERRDDETD